MRQAKVIGIATVAAGETLSDVVDLTGVDNHLIGLIWPARGNASSIKLQPMASRDGTPATLIDSVDPTEDWEVPSGTSSGSRFVPDLASFGYFRILLSASQDTDYAVEVTGGG